MADHLSVKPRPGRVMFWVTPRTIGTAFCKCISGIPENEVWYEPFGTGLYAATYLKTKDNVKLPIDAEYVGNEQLFERAANLFGESIGTKIHGERLPYSTTKKGIEGSTSKYVFVKEESISMTTEEARKYIPAGFKHSFIIRNPYLMCKSLHKVGYLQCRDTNTLLEGEVDERTYDMRNHKEEVDTDNIYEDHYNLWKYVKANVDPNPIIIDAHDLLSKPAETLSKYCKAVGLPYSDALLKWDGSADTGLKWKMAGNGVIYNQNIMGVSMTSTQFTPPRQPPPRDQLTDDVIELGDKAMPFYREMYENRIKV